MGKLQWPPSVFWQATLIELETAASGLAKFHGVEESKENLNPLSTKEFIALKEKLNA